MSDDKNSVIPGIVITALLFVTLLVILVSEPFPESVTVHNEMIPTQPGSGLGGAMSEFLWNYRGLDLTFQTILLFTTAICCLAMLREEMRK